MPNRQTIAFWVALCTLLLVVFWLGLDATKHYTARKLAEVTQTTENKELTRAHQIIENIFDVKIDKTFSSYSIPVTASAYTAREEECNENPEVTADMTPSRVGLLAVSRDLIQDMGLKFGDTVMLLDHGEFLGAFVIHDVMNARYKNRVDVLHGNLKAARLFGVKRGVLLIRIVGDS